MKANIVDDIRSDPGRAAGAIEIRRWNREPGRKVAGFACRCPCGCGSEMWLPVHLAGEGKLHGGPEWEWDGNLETPTIMPSVFNTGLPCKWHGWLRAGRWELA